MNIVLMAIIPGSKFFSSLGIAAPLLCLMLVTGCISFAPSTSAVTTTPATETQHASGQQVPVQISSIPTWNSTSESVNCPPGADCSAIQINPIPAIRAGEFVTIAGITTLASGENITIEIVSGWQECSKRLRPCPETVEYCCG